MTGALSTQSTERQAAALWRTRQAVSLIGDVDLAGIEARYGGLDSTEHDDVQTLVAFARELRQIMARLRAEDVRPPCTITRSGSRSR